MFSSIYLLLSILKLGLQRGDITPQHLHQQLAANPAMQPRHRELLYTILKLQQRGGAGGGSVVGPSPRVLSPVPPILQQQQQQQQQTQQQQLRVSPLPPNGESANVGLLLYYFYFFVPAFPFLFHYPL